ncbi:hypothetical protein EBR44_09390 [bacterium]|nr:hypothetical protein [bacterium]
MAAVIGVPPCRAQHHPINRERRSAPDHQCRNVQVANRQRHHLVIAVVRRPRIRQSLECHGFNYRPTPTDTARAGQSVRSRGQSAVGTAEGGVMARVIDAVRARATVGEISDTLESVWGRYRPN